MEEAGVTDYTDTAWDFQIQEGTTELKPDRGRIFTFNICIPRSFSGSGESAIHWRSVGEPVSGRICALYCPT